MSRRMNTLMSILAKAPVAIEPNYGKELLSAVNGDYEMPINTKEDAVCYEVSGHIATIFIDGVMHKKDINGLCISVASYDKIIGYIQSANNNHNVKNIICVVDTRGGAIDGVTNVNTAIRTSNKPVTVCAENWMCSAGLWAFSGANKIYATDTTIIGSIGALLIGGKQDGEDKTYKLVSKNAENKICNIENGSCEQKAQVMLDGYEGKFLSALSKNFNKDENEIIEDFNNGGTLFACEVKKLGYIDGVKTYQEVFEELSATMPSSEKIANSKIGAEMPKNLDEALNVIAEQQVELDKKDSMIAELNAKLDGEVLAKEILAAVMATAQTLQVDEKVVAEALTKGSVTEAKLYLHENASAIENIEQGSILGVVTGQQQRQAPVEQTFTYR